MGYTRTHVRQAFLAAQDAGKDLSTLRIGDRETVLQLERWGFLPLDQSMYDKKIADWYVANGLARPADTPNDTRDDAPRDTPDVPLLPHHAAFAAAEAALATAQACLELARLSGGGSSP